LIHLNITPKEFIKIEKRFIPGTLVNCRKRLWRVDYQEGNFLNVTAVDESTKQTKIYLPVEDVSPGNLPKPSYTEIGTPQTQKLMLDAFRLSMVNSTTPLRSLQLSRAIPVSYQLVPVFGIAETCLVIAFGALVLAIPVLSFTRAWLVYNPLFYCLCARKTCQEYVVGYVFRRQRRLKT
jgi:hypothetical protein